MIETVYEIGENLLQSFLMRSDFCEFLVSERDTPRIKDLLCKDRMV